MGRQEKEKKATPRNPLSWNPKPSLLYYYGIKSEKVNALLGFTVSCPATPPRSLEFERAAELRDELSRLKKLLPAGVKK